MNVKNKSGFSIVELMVVVAIIGILATIAVPNFQKFQAKAKQASAKTELSGIYTAEKAFYAEYSTYNGALNHIGFVPDGVSDAGAIQAGITRIYTSGFDSAEVCDNTNCGGFRVPGSLAAVTRYPHNVPGVTSQPALTLSSTAPNDLNLGVDIFLAQSIGYPRNTVTPDIWTINQMKSLLNTTVGL